MPSMRVIWTCFSMLLCSFKRGRLNSCHHSAAHASLSLELITILLSWRNCIILTKSWSKWVTSLVWRTSLRTPWSIKSRRIKQTYCRQMCWKKRQAFKSSSMKFGSSLTSTYQAFSTKSNSKHLYSSICLSSRQTLSSQTRNLFRFSSNSTRTATVKSKRMRWLVSLWNWWKTTKWKEGLGCDSPMTCFHRMPPTTIFFPLAIKVIDTCPAFFLWSLRERKKTQKLF